MAPSPPRGRRRWARCCAISATSTCAEEAYPGGLPARAEKLAAERSAARSHRLADPGRAQRGAGRRAQAKPRHRIAAGRGASPTWTMSKRRWPSGWTARITATMCCGCCSSAAIPTCRRPSRSRWRCASSRASPCSQIARAFLVGEAAMEQRITRAKARIAARRRAVRDAGRRPSAASGWPRSRPWSI